MANARALTSASFMLGLLDRSRFGSLDIRLFAAVDGDVERGAAGEIRGARQRLRMAQRAHRVVVSRRPMIGHAGARELVILGLAFVFSGPVDQVNDLVDAMI